MTLRKHIAFLIFISFLSCDQMETGKDRGSTSVFPHILDSSKSNHQFAYETWLTTADYEPFYIGTEKESIQVDWYTDLKIRESYDPTGNAYIMDNLISSKSCISCESAQLQIRIDTSQLINNKGVTSYPVVIKNLEGDTVCIALGEKVHAIMEARDKDGLWKPIETNWRWTCGNGLGATLLPPDEIVLVAARIFEGEFLTEVRIRVGNNYSMPFFGKIHPRQFKSRFNDVGNYNEEYLKEREEKRKLTQ